MDRALKNAMTYALHVCATLADPVTELWDYRGVADYPADEAAALAEVLYRHGYIEAIPYTLEGSRQARFKPRVLNLMYNAESCPAEGGISAGDALPTGSAWFPSPEFL